MIQIRSRTVALLLLLVSVVSAQDDCVRNVTLSKNKCEFTICRSSSECGHSYCEQSVADEFKTFNNTKYTGICLSLRGRVKECNNTKINSSDTNDAGNLGFNGFYKCPGAKCERNVDCWSFDCVKKDVKDQFGSCGDETGLESIHILLITVGSLLQIGRAHV